ncbi:hypothetical protein HDU98_005345 [Podochytrium sp. JEL0797]|nr:hypothetical protein HDU98_005345 [Podochytrium sp. JEL0797]
MVCRSWFMTVFVNVLPIETVMRVWDCFCYQGEKVLMRVTLTLLKIHEDEVLACSDTTDAWRLIKEIPSRMIDAHKLMEICFKPRVNLNPFDAAASASSSTHDSQHHHLHPRTSTAAHTAGSSNSSLAAPYSSGMSVKSVDSDDDFPSYHRGGAGGAGFVIENDPLRKFSEKLAKGGAGGGANGGGKVPRRGVGSVSTKMIEHYRALAVSERKKK